MAVLSRGTGTTRRQKSNEEHHCGKKATDAETIFTRKFLRFFVNNLELKSMA